MTMTYAITPTQMKQMMRVFTEHHVDGEKDHIGPNAGDAPFFNRLANLSDDIPEHEYQEAAERLYKYRHTQIPYMAAAAGLPEHVDVDKFLQHMTEVGVRAKARRAATNRTTTLIIKALEDTPTAPHSRPSLQSFDEAVQANIAVLFEDYGMTRAELDVIYAQVYEQWKTDREIRVRTLTVQCEVYEDVWYGKNDTQRRWPKKSRRIALRFPRHTACKDELKQVVGFPAFKWTGEFWSLSYTREAIDKAVPVFKKHGFFTEQLSALSTRAAQTTRASEAQLSATIEGETVVLKWPYLKDDDLRNRVKSIVKGIMGRKFDGDRKAWLVPVAQAAFLRGRLEGVYDPLAEAIASLPELQEVISNTAERIAISGAAELHDEATIESMRARLAEQFPEGRELYPFQYVGVRFAELAGGRALIGDDMGVGKTIQALAYAALHPEQHPVLVVCPANVKYNWLKEARAWLPKLSSSVVENGKSDIPASDIVIINYDLMSKQQFPLEDACFGTVIFDESHYLKNPKAKRTKASLAVAKPADSVLCLSGTAITNRPVEFFTTLNLIRPAEFSNFFSYAKRYTDAFHNGFGWDFKGSSNEAELHERTRTLSIRRLKKEVMAELPDKIRQIVDTHPSAKERKEYNDVQRSWLSQYQMHKASGSLPPGFVLNMLTELRHHAGRMKIGATADWVREYNDMTRKPVVVFAHHKDVIEMLTEELKDFRLGFITGSVKSEQRQVMVDDFQAGNLDVLICSTIAAKEGLTLTAADTVVFVEREWVPGWEEQAEDRVNRIGQDAETVHAVYLSVAGTIDEKFNAVIEEKRATVSAILDGGDITERSGIAKALLEAMVAAGDLPADMVKDLGV